MQVKRKAWLDDVKRGGSASDPTMKDAQEDVPPDETSLMELDPKDRATEESPQAQANSEQNVYEQIPEDDELDALLAESGANPVAQKQDMQDRPRGPFMEAEPDDDEDDLDALLAEHDMG